MNAINSRTFTLLKASSNVTLHFGKRLSKQFVQRRAHSNLVSKETDVRPINEASKTITNLYTFRTHNCGEVSSKHLNETVCLAGWIQFERFKKFYVLRDKYGTVQLIIKDKQLQKRFKNKLSLESLIVLKGRVTARPAEDVNSSMKNGDIEVEVNEIDLVNECDKELSIHFNTLYKEPEDLCLKHRYVHLRSPELQNNLQSRSNFVHSIRRSLIEALGFVEIETPTLFKNTPGGANEFVVPTRFKDKYYTLTQSPQQFKQLLMIGSVDKYFQIARCYRDESTRSDRQPEFTQLDLELSFTTSEHVQQLVEHLLQTTWLKQLETIRTPFRRMRYADCISNYGIDKPDLRLALELNDLTNRLNSVNNGVDSVTERAFSICIKQWVHLDPSIQNRIRIAIHEKLNHHSKSNKLASYLIQVESEGKLNAEKIRLDDDASSNDASRSDVEQNESTSQTNESTDDVNESKTSECDSNDWMILNNLKIADLLEKGSDCLILCIGNLSSLNDVVGKIRNAIIPLILTDKQISQANGLDKEKYSFLWVVDFPLFSKEDEDLDSNHHPFTAPISEHNELIYKDPLSVIGQHYDLVLNGYEIGGGSIRIHDYAMQKYVFETILKSDVSQMNYFLNALRTGCPPHGGIALGIDRLLSVMLETESIRDVIAFPKTTNGRDAMSDAPNELSAKSKLFYHLN